MARNSILIKELRIRGRRKGISYTLVKIIMIIKNGDGQQIRTFLKRKKRRRRNKTVKKH